MYEIKPYTEEYAKYELKFIAIVANEIKKVILMKILKVLN